MMVIYLLIKEQITIVVSIPDLESEENKERDNKTEENRIQASELFIRKNSCMEKEYKRNSYLNKEKENEITDVIKDGLEEQSPHETLKEEIEINLQNSTESIEKSSIENINIDPNNPEKEIESDIVDINRLELDKNYRKNSFIKKSKISNLIESNTTSNASNKIKNHNLVIPCEIMEKLERDGIASFESSPIENKENFDKEPEKKEIEYDRLNIDKEILNENFEKIIPTSNNDALKQPIINENTAEKDSLILNLRKERKLSKRNSLYRGDMFELNPEEFNKNSENIIVKNVYNFSIPKKFRII
jgi:hypothetical protein